MPTTLYVWDVENDSLIEELDGSGNSIVTYTQTPNQFGGTISEDRGGSTSYYHYDGLGSTLALSNQSGVVTDEYSYSAYGEVVASSGSSANPFKYVGKYGYYTDSETNDIYIRARTYQPTVARWCSRDPLKYHGSKANLFGYAGFNPLNRTDPSGNVALPVALYEIIVIDVCFYWAQSIQKNYPSDTHTTMQHCAANCCVARLNLTLPIGWLPSLGFDNPFWGTDPKEDWIANVRGYVAANRIDMSCVSACCDELGFCTPCPYSGGKPKTLPPYQPLDPLEATDTLCANKSRNEVMEDFPGPSPEADEAYENCHQRCMRANRF